MTLGGSSALVLVLWIGFPTRGWTDIVHLKSGARIEGEIRKDRDKDTIEVEVGEGTIVRYPLSEVERIECKENPRDVFQRRLEKIRPRDLDRLVDLLKWAQEYRLNKRAKSVAERILKVDAHHEFARSVLGYVVFRNRWVLRSKLPKGERLVRVDGEWVTKHERSRRAAIERERAIRELLPLVDSSNEIVRHYALQQLDQELGRADDDVVRILGEGLKDKSAAVRMVVVLSLRKFPHTKSSEGKKNGVDRVARELHALALREKNEQVRKELRRTLATFHPRKNFRLALEAATTAREANEIKRIAAIVLATLKKAWVPELCRAVESSAGSESIRVALRQLLKEDHGYDVDRWLALWERRKDDFRDVE